MKKGKILKSKKAFTLVEFLLYIGIAAGVIFSIFFFLGSMMQDRIKNQTISDIEQQGSFVLQMVNQRARNATSINSPAAGGSSSSLSLAFDDAAVNPTLFDVSGGTVRMKEGASPYVNLTDSNVAVDSLTFRNLTRTGTYGNIQVELDLSHINPNSRNEYNFSKIFYGTASLRY